MTARTVGAMVVRSWFKGVGFERWTAVPLWASALVVLIELIGWQLDWWWHLGLIPLLPGVVVAVLFLAAVSVGQRLDAKSWTLIGFAVPAVVGAAFLAGPDAMLGVVLAGAAEESVYRVALPATVAVLAVRFLRVPAKWAVLAALATSGVVFMVLPGHVAQYSESWSGPLPWFALAAMWSWMLWKGASPIAVAAHHMGLNATAFATMLGAAWWWWLVLVNVPVLAFFIQCWVAESKQARTTPALT